MFPREYVVSLFPKRGKDRHKFYIGNEKWGKCFLYTLCVMTQRSCDDTTRCDDRGADDTGGDDTTRCDDRRADDTGGDDKLRLMTQHVVMTAERMTPKVMTAERMTTLWMTLRDDRSG